MSYLRNVWVLEAPGAELKLFSTRERAEHYAEAWRMSFPDDDACLITEFREVRERAVMTFEEWRDRQGFPVTSTQEPLWRKCWDAAQGTST